MKKPSYLLRIDDACGSMRRSSFERIHGACKQYGIKPIIGIVPDNQDSALCIDKEWPDFWQYMNQVAKEGWIIAQHGYQHIYSKNRKTEFAGLPYAEQYA